MTYPCTEAVSATTQMAEDVFAECDPVTMIDVGCGSGDSLLAFRYLGAWVHGFDSGAEAQERCAERNLPFTRLDLRDAASREAVAETVDLVTCFGAAECLPEECADGLVRFLTARAPVVCFSAADVGQGRMCHYGGRPKSYWIALFDSSHFAYDQEVSERLRAGWLSRELLPHISENFLLFRSMGFAGRHSSVNTRPPLSAGGR